MIRIAYHILFFNLFCTIKYFDRKKRYPDFAYAINAISFLSAHISLNILVILSIIQRKINIHLTKYYLQWFIFILLFSKNKLEKETFNSERRHRKFNSM